MNVAEFLTGTASAQPDSVALRLDQAVVTYRELDESSARVAAMLAAEGVEPGDRVALMLPNVPEFAVVYYGILRAGAVAVPMNPLLKAREIRYYLADSAAKLIFVWPVVADEAMAGADSAKVVPAEPANFAAMIANFAAGDEVADRATSDTAVLLYTSGTTGQPKGAELTHGNLVHNVEASLGDLLRLGPDDVVFGGLPLFHAFGQTCALNASVASGATLLLLPRFDPEAALTQLVAHHATVFAGVPTMYSALLASASTERPKLKLCISGGAALPVEVLQAFEERFGTVILEGYGLSETSPVACFNRADARKAGSIGTPITGVEMKLVNSSDEQLAAGEVGEIAIRGDNIMQGYWNKPDATAAVLSADGWFRTGDLGRVDEDGFFYVVGRNKDLIIRGGYNIYPRELEELLYEHPAVLEAAVIGVAHATLGEEVGAAVVLHAGAELSAGDLRAYVKRNVAAYKYPRLVWFVDSLPKGPTGKILKREIVPPAADAESENGS
ncbi:MAG TPA: long-chain fatty acid--CoA ligase [Jatrophihabitans sp.]|jgi:long-chain acyl-CoA synthetase